jgi:radical SAM protein with 4Fe4S-binding SPASM domain
MIINRVKRAVRVYSADKNCPTLEITTIFPCVNNCRYCPQDKWRKAYSGKSRLTYAEFCDVLKKIPKNVRLDFSGFSEPFANRESSLMMRHAFEQGYQVALFTTLVGLRQKDVEVLKGVHIYPCVIHMPDDTYFKVKDEERWLESFRLFIKHIPYDDAVYHLGNISEKIKNEVRKIRVRPTFSRSNNVDPEVVERYPRRKGIISCSVSRDAFNQNVMMPNGDVYLCCMDWSLQHKLGNLFEQSYEELHRSETYKKISLSMQDESIETICRYCARCN